MKATELGPDRAPLALRPEPCRAHGCVYTMVQDASDDDDDPFDTFAFIHAQDERTDTLEIPLTLIADPQRDIWGERIKPWIESLHGEEA